MKRVALVAGLLVALASCGGRIEEVSNGPTTGSATSAPTGTTTAAPPSTPPSPGQPTQPPPPTNPTQSTKRISAQAIAGGLDHIMISAADPGDDTCILIHMSRPFGASPSNPYAITAPPEWGVQNISRSPGAKRCGPGKQPPAAEQSTGAKGTIADALPTTSTKIYPCAIDVHVSALFDDSPTVEQIDGTKIVVEDGCQ